MKNRASGWSPEDDRPLPEVPFLPKLAEDLWESYFTLLVWTLALWVLAAPVVLAGAVAAPLGALTALFTLAPGLAGLMVAAGQAARGGFARLGEAARGMFRLYWRSVALAAPLVILLALALATTGVVEAYPERGEMVVAWALQWGLSLAAAILHIYLFPIMALYDTSLKKSLQIAFALVGKHVWQTLVLLAVGLALLALTTLHVLVWLIVPGVWSVVAANATWRLSREMIPEAQVDE